MNVAIHSKEKNLLLTRIPCLAVTKNEGQLEKTCKTNKSCWTNSITCKKTPVTIHKKKNSQAKRVDVRFTVHTCNSKAIQFRPVENNAPATHTHTISFVQKQSVNFNTYLSLRLRKKRNTTSVYLHIH